MMLHQFHFPSSLSTLLCFFHSWSRSLFFAFLLSHFHAETFTFLAPVSVCRLSFVYVVERFLSMTIVASERGSLGRSFVNLCKSAERVFINFRRWCEMSATMIRFYVLPAALWGLRYIDFILCFCLRSQSL